MLKELWFVVGPGLLKLTGETLIYTGQILERVGVSMQETGINLLEARQHLLQAAKERELRQQRIAAARYVP
jgi:hypothetical protein